MEVERGTSNNVVLRWNETDDVWQVSNDEGTYSNVATKASLDALTLNDLFDVNTSAAELGLILQYGDNTWTPSSVESAISGRNIEPNDLTVHGNLTSNAATFNSTVTANGDVTVNGLLTMQEVTEVTADGTITSNTLTVDYTTTNIVYVASPSANFTVNLTNAPTTNDRMMTISVVVSQGATGYIPSVFQIGGVGQTIKWSGGAAPAGTNSKIDIFSFSMLRRSGTWTVFGAVSANY